MKQIGSKCLPVARPDIPFEHKLVNEMSTSSHTAIAFNGFPLGVCYVVVCTDFGQNTCTQNAPLAVQEGGEKDFVVVLATRHVFQRLAVQ